MKPVWMLGAAALLFPVAGVAYAQQTLVEKSSDDIACELAGTCANFDATADSATAASADDGDSPTRGWSLGARRTATPATVAVRPRVRPAAMAASSGSARAGTRNRVQAPKVPGRTTLGITFPRGSSALDGEALGQAQKLYDALKSPALAKYHFMVAGHSDAVGSRNLNMDLSRRRAQAVVDYLVQRGLERDQFRVRGYADERPLGGVTTSSAVNRRVEIIRLD